LPFSWCAVAAALLPAALPGCKTAPRLAVPPPGRENAAEAAKGEKLDELRHVISLAAERYDAIRDYRCVLWKRQRVGGVMQEWRKILLKYRKPGDMYMRWVGKPRRGQELLYIPACDRNRALVRPGGSWGRWTSAVTPPVWIDIGGYWVMRDNIHPVDHAGIGYFLNVFMENAFRARRKEEGMLFDRGLREKEGREVRVIEAVLPAKKREGYYCYRCVVAFDEKSSLPVHVVVYDWDDRLAEEYKYENLETDVGLTDRDFDRNNPEYKF